MVSKHTLSVNGSSSARAVFFDLDETLIKNNIPVRKLFPRVYSDFKEAIEPKSRKIFFEVLQYEVKKLWIHMFDSDTSPEQQLVNCFVKALNETNSLSPDRTPKLAKVMVTHFFKLGAHNVELHDGVIETLTALRKKGITIGIVTNGIKTLQKGKIRHLKLEQYVDSIIISGEAGAHKPDQEIFDLALSKANVTANQAWFVGDHVTNDVAGAVKAGLTSVYYNPQNLHVEKSFVGVLERPDYTINHLSELLEYL